MDQCLIKDLFNELYTDEIVLPDFQREFVWDINKQTNLLSSILVHLSIGSFLLIEGNKDYFLSKELGYTTSRNDDDAKKICKFLLDGQQRLTSIWSFFSDVFVLRNQSMDSGWETAWDKLYEDLRYRWFVKITNVGESDFFGYQKLSFNLDDIITKEPADIFPHIIAYKINKPTEDNAKTKEYEQWFHPEFFSEMKRQLKNNKEKFIEKLGLNANINDNDAEEIQDVITNYYLNQASNEGLVPLYTIWDNPNKQDTDDYKIYENVITYIANKRVAEIRNELETCSKLDQLKKLITDYFGKSRTSSLTKSCKKWTRISQLKKSTYIADLTKLQSDWESSVQQYFKDRILSTPINRIMLPVEQIQRAIAIFRAINEGGQKLSTFDLVVAKAAKEYKNKSFLTEIKKKIETSIDIPNALSSDKNKDNWSLLNMGCILKKKMDTKFQEIFLNVLSAIVFANCKNEPEGVNKLSVEHFKAIKHLAMTPKQIVDNFDDAIVALQRAHAFLQFRCGIVSGKDIQYRLMILPIALCLLHDNCWKDAYKLNKLECWYWSSIFSGVYREAPNEAACKDIKYMYAMLIQEDNTDNLNNIAKELSIPPLETRCNNIFNNKDYSDIDTLCLKNNYVTIPAAIHCSILQYILSLNPLDFLPADYGEFRLKAWEIAKVKYKIGDFELSFQYQVKNKKGELENKIDRIKNIEDHHIIPLKEATNIKQSSKEIRSDKKHLLNSTLNRTYISNLANKNISDMTPDKYFNYLKDSALSDHYASDLFKTKCWFLGIDGKNQEEMREALKERFSFIKTTMTNELRTLNQ